MICALAALSLLALLQNRPPTAGPEKGWLVIVGGGLVTSEIDSKFRELAGGNKARMVVIPTANADNQIDLEKLRAKGDSRVLTFDVVHTRDPKVADSAEFVKPLLSATGVWFDGGRQWRLADAYLGTRTEREIKAVLDRGGVVGGSSAGATIIGSFLVRGDSGSPEHPDGDNRIMVSPGHIKGFGFLTNCAIDQHVITRHRENDLVQVIQAHPELLGIGIDESTAIVVHANTFEVIGKSKVAIYDGKDHDGKMYYFLSAGQRFDLAKREAIKG